MGLLKKFTRPISKVLDKIIPNEIKPALPYLSAFAPYMMGPGIVGASGFQGALANPWLRAAMAGGLNLGSQLSQEGSEGEFSGISALLAGAQGFGTAAGAPGKLGSWKSDMSDFAPERSFLQKARDVGITGAEKASEFLTGAGETIRDPSAWGLNKETLGAFATPISQGTADLALAEAQRALRDYEDQMAADESTSLIDDDGRRRAIRAAMEAAGHLEEVIVETLGVLGLKDGGVVGMKKGGRVKYDRGGDYYGNFGRDRYLSELTEEGESIMNKGQSFMDQYQAMIESGKLSHAELNDMLKQYNLLQKADEDFTSRYDNTAIEDNVEKQLDKDSFKYYDTKIKDLEKREDDISKQEEGILALEKEMEFDASDVTRSPEFQKWLKLYETDIDKALDHPKAEIFLGVLGLKLKGRDKSYWDVVEKVNKKQGGRINKEGGGVASVLPKGKEADYRGGGVIPVGSRERADDVPARLSKNEFVMTADAVRAAGGGSINKGAKRMYNLMHNLEARV